MTLRTSPLAPEEIARRGDEIYEHQIKPIVEADHLGKIVAIDVESGDYTLGDDVLTASQRLQATHPDAKFWFVRVGHRTLHHI